MTLARPIRSSEFFYLDENGERQDADLHEAMLQNEQADEEGRASSIQALRALGFTEQELAFLFNL